MDSMWMFLSFMAPILLLYIFYVALNSAQSKTSEKKLTIKVIIACVYGVLLIMAPIVYALLPKEEMNPITFDKNQVEIEASIQEEQERLRQLKDLLMEGGFDEVPPEWIAQQWGFEFDDDELHLVPNNNLIYVEKVDAQTDLDVYLIGQKTYHLIRGYQFETSDHLASVAYLSPDSELNIQPEYSRRDNVVKLFDHPFPMKQFQGAFNQVAHSMDPYRADILYIRVPENVEITSYEDYIEVN